MTKKLTLFFILISIFCFSQKYIDAVIIKSNNDTINSKIKIYTNIFYNNIIDERSFYKVLTVVDDNNKKKEKIKAGNIKELKFTDFEEKERTYINDERHLIRLMFNGKKTKWVKDININVYDRSITHSDYLVDQNGKKNSITRKRLIEATKSKPELANIIKNIHKFSDEIILNILQKYDE